MSDPLIDAENDAATPLTPEERDALIPTFIMQRTVLDEAEQMGVDAADRWAFEFPIVWSLATGFDRDHAR